VLLEEAEVGDSAKGELTGVDKAMKTKCGGL
jgi:hypothetical protein